MKHALLLQLYLALFLIGQQLHSPSQVSSIELGSNILSIAFDIVPGYDFLSNRSLDFDLETLKQGCLALGKVIKFGSEDHSYLKLLPWHGFCQLGNDFFALFSGPAEMAYHCQLRH